MKHSKLALLIICILTFSCRNENKVEAIRQNKNQFNYRIDSVDILNNYKNLNDINLSEDSVEKKINLFVYEKIKIKLNENNYSIDTILCRLLINVFDEKFKKFPNNLSLRYSKIVFGIKTENLIVCRNELLYVMKKTYEKKDWKLTAKSVDKEVLDNVIDKINFYNRQIQFKSLPIFKEISDTLLKYDEDNITNLILRANYFRLEKKYPEAINSLDNADKGISVTMKNGNIQVVNDQTDEVNFNRVFIYNDMNDQKSSKKYYNKIKSEFLKAQIKTK